jgi:O-antigen biosynthesis protein
MTSTTIGERVADCIDLWAFYNPFFQACDGRVEAGPDSWMKVRGARQNFVGHLQPIEPDELGYYDLRDPKIIAAQAALARQFGIRGFCWRLRSSGRRWLGADSLDAMLANHKIDMPVCICWEAEDQQTDPNQDNARALIHDVMKYLKHPRYLRLGGQAVLLIERVDRLANPSEFSRLCKETVRDAGCGEIELWAVGANADQTTLDGFDAFVEAPPNPQFLETRPALPDLKIINQHFHGRIFDYSDMREWHLARPSWQASRWYRSVVVRWDTTASGQDDADIARGSTALEYYQWLYWAGLQALLAYPQGRRLLFIDSWNDWTNGSTLEPDSCDGRAYLWATRDALQKLNERVLLFDDYWSALAALGDVAAKSAASIRSLIMNYERSLTALRQLPPRQVAQSPGQPPANIDDAFRSSSIRRLTGAYLRRLAIGFWRRMRAMKPRWW